MDTAEEILLQVASISEVETTAYQETIKSFEQENIDKIDYIAPTPEHHISKLEV